MRSWCSAQTATADANGLGSWLQERSIRLLVWPKIFDSAVTSYPSADRNMRVKIFLRLPTGVVVALYASNPQRLVKKRGCGKVASGRSMVDNNCQSSTEGLAITSGYLGVDC